MGVGIRNIQYWFNSVNNWILDGSALSAAIFSILGATFAGEYACEGNLGQEGVLALLLVLRLMVLRQATRDSAWAVHDYSPAVYALAVND